MGDSFDEKLIHFVDLEAKKRGLEAHLADVKAEQNKLQDELMALLPRQRRFKYQLDQPQIGRVTVFQAISKHPKARDKDVRRVVRALLAAGFDGWLLPDFQAMKDWIEEGKALPGDVADAVEYFEVPVLRVRSLPARPPDPEVFVKMV